ncbi:MAG: pyruvate formate lyase family protein [Escherichia coli]
MKNCGKCKPLLICTELFPKQNLTKREVACLRTQFSFILQSIRPDDLLAGRMTLLPVGFMPQPAMERGQGVGYYCDEELLQEWASDPNLTLEEQRILWELIHYWKHNTTEARTERLYSADQWRYMTHGNYRALPGAAYPLYRISGTQLDFCKLLENGLNGLRTAVTTAKRQKSRLFFRCG